MDCEPQTITQVTPTYIMKAGLHFKILYIQLKILQQKIAKLYQVTLSEENLSVELKLVFGETQTIFYCLFNRQTYEVVPQRAQILIKMPQEIANQQRKTCILGLSEKFISKQELTSSIIRDLATQVQITKNSHTLDLQKMKQSFTKKIKKQRQNLRSVEKQNLKMKRMVRQMNKMIRQLIKIKRKVNGFQEQATDPQLIPEESEDQNYEGKQIQSTQINVPVDFNSKHYPKFTITQNNIKYDTQDPQFTQLLMAKVIPFQRVYKFSLRVTNSKNNKILIGIVSRQRIKKRSSFNSGEAFCYYGYNGWICDKKSTNFQNYEKKGNGFKTGETVTVTVDLSKGFIQWHVEDRLMANYYNDLLRRQKHTFVPYLQLHDSGDIVRWLN